MATALAERLRAGGPRSRREFYERVAQGMLSVRQGSGYDAHWQDIADFLFPSRVRFNITDRNKGTKKNSNILDSTGKFALWTLRSGLHAGLTSPARPWFKLGTPDPDLAEFGPVKEWLHIVTERMRTVFHSTNLYQSLPTVYGDFGGFGTAAMGCFDDSEDLFRTYAFPLGSYSLGLDQRGIVRSFTRDYELSVRQVVESFAVVPGTTNIIWDSISSVVKDAWNRGDYELAVPITHVVMPNEEFNPNKLLAKFKRFASVHYETNTKQTLSRDTDKFLRESGFDDFPILAPRWEVTGEDSYGTDCPGMTALGDVRQLQSMQRRKGQLLQKAVDPTLMGPSSLRTQKVSLVSGDITYVDAREGQQGLKPIHEIRLEGFQHITADAQDMRYLIRRAFYEDLFLMLAASDPAGRGQPITAREVEERHEEKLIALGPVLERTNDELLSPLIDLTFNKMFKAGLLPPPPDDIRGVKLRVEFTSILAQAQKAIGISALDRFVVSVTPIIQLDPAQRHKVDFDQIIENYQEGLGTDPRIIRSTEEAQRMRDEEAQQQQAMAQAQTMKDMASAAATAGKEPIATDSALDRVLAGVGA
jgi:hypothetical protein